MVVRLLAGIRLELVPSRKLLQPGVDNQRRRDARRYLKFHLFQEHRLQNKRRQ